MADNRNFLNNNKGIRDSHFVPDGTPSNKWRYDTWAFTEQFVPLQHNELTNVVIQGSSWKAATALQSTPTKTLSKVKAAAFPTFNKAVAREDNVEENERGKRRMIADSSPTSCEPSDLYWVLPNYAKPFKKDIKNIIEKEKAKLCSNKQFNFFCLKMLNSNLHLLIAETLNRW